MRKIISIIAAASMACAPAIANAAAPAGGSAASLSLSGLSSALAAQDEAPEGASTGGGGTAIALGFFLLVLIGVAAISGDDNEPNNTPASP